jgi:hypothetical protein
MLTSFRQQVAVVVARQQVVAVVRQRVAAVVVHRQVVAVVRQRVAVVQRAVALLQAVPLAFAGKIQQTELCLPLQVAIAFSFCLPPKKFYSYYILILNRLSSFFINYIAHDIILVTKSTGMKTCWFMFLKPRSGKEGILQK